MTSSKTSKQKELYPKSVSGSLIIWTMILGYLLRRIYDALLMIPWKTNSIPAAVLIIAKYQYQIAFVADQEINYAWLALTELMV